ncbi:MAG: pilus assembly protein TadG-related protein [Proteobacteria bacterium]|nr:pilus assembly protein TadG-related protein [Pseudomonadota bacterium]
MTPTTRMTGCWTSGALRRFAQARDGAIAIIFALALLPLLLAAGAAIDLGRAYMVKSRLGYAIDAAALAVGAATTTDEDELEAVMLAFFDANYPATELGVPATPVMVINDSEVSIYATAEVDTTLMSIAHVETLTVSAETLVIRETKGLEVALVLDNTGSMGTTKMNNLKDAAQIFLDILYGNEDENELLKIAVVPFAGSVNVGTNFGFLRFSFDEDDWHPDDWDGCVMARRGSRDRNDAAPINNTTRWAAYLWPNSRNNNWPPVKSFKGPNLDCPEPLLPLTTTKGTVEDKIEDMHSAGITHINVGLVWGWRVLSPGEPFTQGVAYDNEEFNKAIVLMTDGENFFSGSSFGAYRFLSQGLLGTTNSITAIRRLNSRTTEVCNAIKAEGILIYTITFQVASNTARNLMRDCATDTSKYFDSPNAATLTQTFRAIGKELSNLRIGG